MKLEDTLFGQYIKERERAEIIEAPEGFVTYRIDGKNLFIIDAFVKPQSRKQGVIRDLIAQAEYIAGKASCQFLTANIHLNDQHASKTLTAALLIGFQVMAANAGTITIIKTVGGK